MEFGLKQTSKIREVAFYWADALPVTQPTFVEALNAVAGKFKRLNNYPVDLVKRLSVDLEDVANETSLSATLAVSAQHKS